MLNSYLQLAFWLFVATALTLAYLYALWWATINKKRLWFFVILIIGLIPGLVFAMMTKTSEDIFWRSIGIVIGFYLPIPAILQTANNKRFWWFCLIGISWLVFSPVAVILSFIYLQINGSIVYNPFVEWPYVKE